MCCAHAGTLKSPPYLVHSEKAVLGTLLAHPDLITEVRGIVRDRTAFFRDNHGLVYEILLELHDERGSFELNDVMDAARAEGLVSDAVGTKVIDDLVQGAVAPAAALEHARQLQDKALMRRLIDVVSEILYDASRASDGFIDVLARARGRLDDLEAGAVGEPNPDE